MPFVFVVPPGHPLAEAPEPLDDALLLQHRAVAAADSSRRLPPSTSALLGGQQVLTVPTIQDKHRAHLAGLGIGFMPAWMVAEDLAVGRLLQREVSNPLQPYPRLLLAWKQQHKGRALRWFVAQLEDGAHFADVLQPATA
jgi:DNA-binding transcriptional LysR family regulator